MSAQSLLLPLAVSTALLAGCSGLSQDAYPSLAIRDVERVTGTLAPPEPRYVPPPPPADALDRLDSLLMQARTAHASFEEQAPALRDTVQAAGGSGVGTESWARGSVALAELESLRSEAMIALAELDRLYVDAAVEGQALAQLATTRDEVIALVEEEDRQIEALGAILAR